MVENHETSQGAEGKLFGNGRWKVDAEASTAEFSAKTFWGLLTVRGHFDQLDGSLEVGPGPDQVNGELKIGVDSIDTGNAKRDKHLRSADFFDAENHPDVIFKLERLSDSGGGRAKLGGTLEAAGKTTPLELDAAVSEDSGGLSLEGEATVEKTTFGMNWSPLGMVKPEAKLHVKARLDPA